MDKEKISLTDKSLIPYDLPLLNSKLESYGFQMSRTTKADGNCLLHAVLDQTDDFSDTKSARKSVIQEMKNSLKEGRIDSGFFEPSPQVYMREMKEDGEQCDSLFITFLAFILERDFVIYNVHGDKWCRIYGGQLMSEVSSTEDPIYLAYFEEDFYASGHYQSIKKLQIKELSVPEKSEEEEFQKEMSDQTEESSESSDNTSMDGDQLAERDFEEEDRNSLRYFGFGLTVLFIIIIPITLWLYVIIRLWFR